MCASPTAAFFHSLLHVKTPHQGKLLGKGGFAKAYWCTCLQTQKQYALKVVLKETLTKPKAKAKLQVLQCMDTLREALDSLMCRERLKFLNRYYMHVVLL